MDHENHASSDTTAAQRVAQEARAAIDAWQQVLAERGLTQAACLEALRRAGGEAAVDKVRGDAAGALQALDDRVSRDVMHRPGSARPRTRRLLLRGGV